MRFLLLAMFATATLLPACNTGAGGTDEATQQTELWTCPMHPQVVRAEPGSCPICSMDLVPMKGEQAAGDEDLVAITPGVVQQIGVETMPVEHTTLYRHLRTIGEVEVGEDELSVVNLRLSGWVERIYVDRTGDEVKRGQALFELYSPELVAAQQEYLIARRTEGPDAPLTRSVRRKLELWNLAERDIERIVQAGEASRTVPIRAPQSGYILHKNLVEGARVNAGQDLYRIGNLQRIWVTAEVYEHDAPWVEVGQAAQLELTHLAGSPVEGRVSYIYPTLNQKSRTLTVRLEFENPGVRLKPGMFATVHIQYRRMENVIAVPSAAILHTGRRQVVFVAKGGGRFEPREITTGLQGDHHMAEVLSGLSEGEVVVTSGQFLIDAESQLQEAMRRMTAGTSDDHADHDHPDHVWSCPMHPEVLAGGPGSCPQCGMNLEKRPGTEAERHEVYGVQAAPGQYTCPMHPEVVSDEAGRCPQCGMFLEKVPDDEATTAE